MARRRRHLYKGRGTPARERREFERRYGRRGGRRHRGGDYIYGAVVGKVRRERAARRIAHSERHARGHHKPPCSPSCRAGRMPHHHRGRRRRRAR